MTWLLRQIICFSLLLLLAPQLHAGLQESRNQLAQIRKQIREANEDLQKKQQSEQSYSRKLALLKRSLQKLDEQIKALKSEQRQLQKKIVARQKEISASQQTIKRIGRRLEKRLVALYKEGDVGPLKILFSADSPTELVQQYQYLTRVMENDQELLGEYRQAVEKYQQGLAEMEQLDRQKADMLQEQQAQRDVAAEGRRVQANLLKKVKGEKKQLKQELAQLKEREKRLKSLITRLQQSDSGQSGTAGASSFIAGKGHLAWPVQGDVLIGFGTQKDKSLGTYYESNGIEIAVAPGTSIRAVADGKVVFADWFKGYGNLLILSHPGGYHTLYAQAEDLQKRLGDEVKAGTVLGKSGLGGRDSIYFEIRQDGSPVNPLKWLQRR